MSTHPEPDPVPLAPPGVAAARRAVATLRRAESVFLFGIGALTAATAVMSVRAGDGATGFFAATIVLGLGILGQALTKISLTGFAALLDVTADQAETLARIEARLSAAAPTPTAPAAPGTGALPEPVSSLRAAHLAEIRQAIRSGSWADAETLLNAFRDAHPDDPEAARVGDELAAAVASARAALLDRIAAAREANDAERALDLRDEARPLLDPEALRGLDRDLAKWSMSLIQRRLRAGTVRPDVATLAARVARSLDGTIEGASLRASLPTLRRAAGLCARCGQPYTGIADACPACLASPPAPSQEPEAGRTEGGERRAED
jgi:hypothetical protein